MQQSKSADKPQAMNNYTSELPRNILLSLADDDLPGVSYQIIEDNYRLGKFNYDKKLYKRALKHFQAALDQAQKKNIKPWIGRCAYLSAKSAAQLQKLEDAERLINRAIQNTEEKEKLDVFADEPIYFRTFYALLALHPKKNDVNLAHKQLLAVESLASEPSYYGALILLMIGKVKSLLGQTSESDKYSIRGIQMLYERYTKPEKDHFLESLLPVNAIADLLSNSSVTDPEIRAKALIIAGFLQDKQGKYKAAAQSLKTAVDLPLEDLYLIYSTLFRAGLYLKKSGAKADAQHYFTIAQQTATNDKERDMCRIQIAELMFEERDADGALNLLKDKPAPELKAEYHLRLAVCMLPKSAQEAKMNLQSTLEGISTLSTEDQIQVRTMLGRLLLAERHFEEAVTHLTEALNSYDVLSADIESEDENSLDLDVRRVTLLRKQAQVSDLLMLAQIGIGNHDSALMTLENSRARACVQYLKTKYEQYMHKFTLQTIIDSSESNKLTMIVYHIIDQQELGVGSNEVLLTWVISPTNKVHFHQKKIDSNDFKSLTDLVTRTRDSIGTRSSTSTESMDSGTHRGVPSKSVELHGVVSTEECLAALYNVLIGPIKDYLPISKEPEEDSFWDDQRPALLFVPSGPLFLIPFAALGTPSDKALIDSFVMSVQYSIQLFMLTQKMYRDKPLTRHHTEDKDITPRCLLVGHPHRPDLPSLPYAEQEASDVQTAFEGWNCELRMLLNAEAAKEKILAELSSSHLVHFATHAGLNNTVTESGEVFTGSIELAGNNGSLWSNEIQLLNLKHTEMVVLSACNTARGDISSDGVAGLVRAFLLAGVPTVIASLWPISDEKTVQLMVDFYNNFILFRLPKDVALRNAMLAARDRDPAYLVWAPFILVGQPNDEIVAIGFSNLTPKAEEFSPVLSHRRFIGMPPRAQKSIEANVQAFPLGSQLANLMDFMNNLKDEYYPDPDE